MQTELYSLSRMFSEALYRIPDYQRGYSWGPTQLRQFWNDLEILEEGRDHYTGVLTLEDVPNQDYSKWDDDLWIIQTKRYRPYYVVDGQQRLTTALILLNEIVKSIPEGEQLCYFTPEEIRKKYIFESRDAGVNRSHIFGYEKDNPSYEHLKARIFDSSPDAYNLSEDTIYTHNLTEARNYFRDQVAGVSSRTSLESLFTKVTQHLLFNIYVISRDVDVFVAFETMNNRGKPLSHLELLKNRLIFLATKLPLDQHQRDGLRRAVNEAWKVAYHYLGRNRLRPLNDDEFLETQLHLYPGQLNPSQTHTQRQFAAVYKEGLWVRHSLIASALEEHFTTRNLHTAPGGVLQPKSIRDYAEHLRSCAEFYYRANNSADSKLSAAVKLQLERIRRLEMFDVRGTAIALMMTEKNENTLASALAALERFGFFRTISRRPDPNVSLPLLARELTCGKLKTRALIDQIDKANNTIAEKVDVREILSSQMYYGWRSAAYFLFEYEQHLQSKAKAKRNKIEWDDFVRESYEADYSTVEHILPQKAKDPYWTVRFGDFSSNERRALTNSLGNLLALSRAKNSSLGNLPFPEKVEGASDQNGYRHGSYSEIEVSKQREWTANEIKERGLLMLGFLEERWNVNLGSKASKLHSLGLSFLGTPDDQLE